MTALLPLSLTKLAAYDVPGIYTIGGQPGQMPERARFLHPYAAASWMKDLRQYLVVSDMLRTAESSLAAVEAGRGAQPPAYSGHNYGFSIDIEVDKAMKKLGLKTKTQLDAWMVERGWWCHRVDHQRGSEDWHYNYLRLYRDLGITPGDPTIAGSVKSTAGYLEALIIAVYGTYLKPDDTTCQFMLQTLKLYSGKIDGAIGPLSKQAISAFQRAWHLKDTSVLDDKTRRTLAFVSCTKVVE